MRSDLKCYVLANYSRKEILDFATRGYPVYAWSQPTLSRRFFMTLKKRRPRKMEGPGQYFGYWAKIQMLL